MSMEIEDYPRFTMISQWACEINLVLGFVMTRLHLCYIYTCDECMP